MMNLRCLFFDHLLVYIGQPRTGSVARTTFTVRCLRCHKTWDWSKTRARNAQRGFFRLPPIRPRLWLRNIGLLLAWAFTITFLISSGALMCEYPLHGIACFVVGAVLAIILLAHSGPGASRRTQ